MAIEAAEKAKMKEMELHDDIAPPSDFEALTCPRILFRFLREPYFS
jgi:hypothetical protein